MPKRVLVVEDDALLGLDIATQLSDAGFDVVGPAISVASAFKLMGQIGCDAAVLDVNLGNETAEAVAIELQAQATPFIVLSGYSSDQHPPGFHGAPTLAKPARPEDLVATLKKCMSETAGSSKSQLFERSDKALLDSAEPLPGTTVRHARGRDREDGE
jgi:DNA-binding response OmpR family regulator